MGLYSKYLLPRIIHLACSAGPTMRQRQKVVPLARGRVLEVGIGSGLNLPFYAPGRVTEVHGLDPSAQLIEKASDAAAGLPLAVHFTTSGAEEMPFEAHTFDTVLLTYTLCTIPDTTSALRQMARVLKPGGQLVFCEHGLAPDAGVRRWQHGLDPVWRRVGGGCHLNRDIPGLIEQGGFAIEALRSKYIPGWRPASFNYWGSAAAR